MSLILLVATVINCFIFQLVYAIDISNHYKLRYRDKLVEIKGILLSSGNRIYNIFASTEIVLYITFEREKKCKGRLQSPRFVCSIKIHNMARKTE